MRTIDRDQFGAMVKENGFILLRNICDLGGLTLQLPTGCTIMVQGGGFINSSSTAATLHLNNAKICGNIDDLIYPTNVNTINFTHIKEGTTKWDSTNHKQLWYNGSDWVDATGATV